jgi:4-carboxymuconolactone decarboxylase
MNSRRTRIYEGKAKILYEGPEPGTIIVHFKDDATAFNAQKKAVLEGKGVINNRISEFVILLVARDWTQDFEFGTHRKHGLKAGLTDDIVAAIAEGRRPQGLDEELSLIWDFVTEVQRTRRVSDTTYGKALARFGEQGVIDLAGIIGYYSLLALTMNVARVAPPQGESYLPRFPE